MGFFGNKSNGQTRPTTNDKGRSIATPASKIKAERRANAERAARAQQSKVEKGKHW